MSTKFGWRTTWAECPEQGCQMSNANTRNWKSLSGKIQSNIKSDGIFLFKRKYKVKMFWVLRYLQQNLVTLSLVSFSMTNVIIAWCCTIAVCSNSNLLWVRWRCSQNVFVFVIVFVACSAKKFRVDRESTRPWWECTNVPFVYMVHHIWCITSGAAPSVMHHWFTHHHHI